MAKLKKANARENKIIKWETGLNKKRAPILAIYKKRTILYDKKSKAHSHWWWRRRYRYYSNNNNRAARNI